MQDDSTQQNSPDSPGWLAKLQLERWQAEILISGGGFIGAVGLMDRTGDVLEVLSHSTPIHPMLAGLITSTLVLLTFMLAEAFLLHLILRGYWIGLVGLHYVFPRGVDQEKLAFKGKFKSFFKSDSNTPHLVKIDGLCSLIFAVAFFIIFSVAGFFLYFTIVGAIVFLLKEFSDLKILRRVISALLASFGLLVLIDFFTFGYLKKVSWMSRFYYPIHYLVSRLTLSFLYRRLYYSIVSNIRPRYIVLGLAAQVLIFFLMGSLESRISKDISPMKSGADSFLELDNEIVTGNSLRFSFSHFPGLEDDLFEEWNKVHKDSLAESFSDIPAKDKFELIGSAYIITIDSSLVENKTWMIKDHVVLGFGSTKLVFLADVSALPRGRHEIAMKMRLKNFEYTQDSVGYYAKAYFLVDK